MGEILKKYPNRASDFAKQFTTMSALELWCLRSGVKGALRWTTGPVVEVGGPSPEGFLSLDNIRLRRGLVITNVENTESATVRADIRALPFRNRSLGGIVMNALDRVPIEVAEKIPSGYAMQFDPALTKVDGHMMRLLRCESENDYTAWNDPEIMDYSLRLALLKEARRTVQPKGLLIAAGLEGGEIQLAEQLGFEVIARTEGEIDRSPVERYQGEVVFQLSNMETPAGKFIEQSYPE